MKILLTGKNGLLGRECLEVFESSHQVLALDIQDLDITDLTRVEEAVSRFRPEAIVNCAAFTQVDLCETERDAAVQGNITGPRNLALSAAHHEALLVHVSSDYVFDGKKPPPNPYLEGDPPGPCPGMAAPSWRVSWPYRASATAMSSCAPPGCMGGMAPIS